MTIGTWSCVRTIYAYPIQVMTLGQGDTGQLGLGEDVAERKKPYPVGGELEGKKIVQVVCGGMHTVALTDDGQVCCQKE